MNKKVANLIFLFLLTGVCALYAQNDSIPEYKLSEIVVLADRLPAVETISVYEVGRQTVQKLDVKNAQEALVHVPGLYFSRTTKNEMSFRIRGFEQRQVNVYFDGVPISVPYDGLVDISQLAGDNFENIRVAKGASSVLYGANTLAGTINIITALPGKQFSYKWRAEGSSQGKIFTNMLLSGSVQKLKYAASLALDKAPEFKIPTDAPVMTNEDGDERDNSTYEKRSANLKLQYELNSAHRIGAHLSFIDNRYDVPANALVERPRYWQFPEWKKNIVSLNTEHILSGRFIVRSIWFRDSYRNVLESYDDDTYSTQSRGYAFTSIYDDYSLGGIIYPQYNWSASNITRGIISYKNDVHREKQEEPAPYDRYAAGILTAGVEHEIHFSDRFKALLGVDGNYLYPLEAEDLSLRDPIFLVNIQASMRYLYSENWEIHGNIGQKSRFPTLKELYSERLGRNVPNPDLQYERSLNAEIGFRWNNSRGYLETGFFQHFLTDHIVNTQVGEGLQQYINIGKVVSRGFELDLRRNWKSVEILANYTYLYTRNRTEDRISPYLEYRPAHQINGLFYYTPVSALMLGIEAGYFADQYYQNPDNLKWGKLNNFGLLNLKGEYNIIQQVSAYLRINNLLDSFYYSEYGVPMPGREFFIGIK
ncbi:MAG: TonB-dependent receptor, partial [Calditrichaeota bacterium]